MFIDERLTEKMSYGSGLSDTFENTKTEVLGGRDFRRLIHPYVLFSQDMQTSDLDATIQTDIVAMFRRANGQFNSFRVKHPYDYSTNALTGVPTFDDQVCEVGDGVYHLTQWYDDETITTAPRRRILKPNAGTVLVGIRDDLDNAQAVVNHFAVDYTTGQITFDANITKAVTDITQAANAVLTVGAAHGLVADDTVHVSTVAGMTGINGLRGKILSVGATTITTDIDSSGFALYTSGGVVNTEPQSSEIVTGGCYFDIPCVFENSTLEVDRSNFEILSTSIGIVETYNP